MTREWWDAVWKSPMATQYLDADMRGGLFQLAYLHQSFWELTDLGLGSIRTLKEVAAEIRMQEVRFGLSPMDRRRLQWEVEKEEEPQAAAAEPKKRKPPAEPVADPRSLFKAVS